MIACVRPTRASSGSLGAILRDARRQSGLSLRDAADGTGISYSSLHRIETGERPGAPLDALLRLATKLEIPHSVITRVTGEFSSDVLQELTAGHLRGAIRGGRLSPEATAALRRVHITGLLDPISPYLSRRPIDLRRLANVLELGVLETAGSPGFDAEGRYCVPRGLDPIQRVVQRAWLAHGLAHVILSQDAGEPPRCTAAAPLLEREREATYLAAQILLPSSLLTGALRLRPIGELATSDEMAAMLDEIVSDFDVLATFVAARLSEESLLAVIPR